MNEEHKSYYAALFLQGGKDIVVTPRFDMVRELHEYIEKRYKIEKDGDYAQVIEATYNVYPNSWRRIYREKVVFDSRDIIRPKVSPNR